MTARIVLLGAMLLPLLVSCSSTIGVVKETLRLTTSCEQAVEPKVTVTDVDPDEHDGAFHIVGKKESLKHICSVYGLDLKKVARINKLEQPYHLEEGETIFLPADALIDIDEDEGATLCASKGKSKVRGRGKGGDRTDIAKAIRGKRHPSVPRLLFPVPGGELTSPFGYRWGVFHKGLDIAAREGTTVLACAPGEVVFTGSRKRFWAYGKIVLLNHGDGVYTQYAHLKKIVVKKGQRVNKGEKIALVGNTGRSTGPHLHLEVRVRNQLYNPLPHIAPPELKRIRVAKRFADSPMGPVRAHWRIPELLAARR